MFADQAAIALRNAWLHEENANRLDELTQAKEEVEELNRILADRVAKTSAELQEVKGHVLRERAEAPLKYSYANIVGRSRRMQELFHLLDKVTESDVPVLIEGESGTGKELVAKAIHFNGPRKDRAFVSENCAAIPETLLESELFGYMRGAFTGATADKKGLFEAANGGTLFLDEIGDMPSEMQKKLLRVLQEREVRPVGGKRAIPIDVRILAASNQNLRRLCTEGRFREDLFYRLNVISVELPPLRDRREDVPLLVERFVNDFAKENSTAPLEVSEDAMAALTAYHWPGNVRELRNEVYRAAALSDKVIVPLILSESVRGRIAETPVVTGLGEKPLKEMVREVAEDLERKVIAAALQKSGGRKSQAARILGVSRPTLDAKLEAYGIEVQRET
jgi:transcriptional regulator with PAS, ATPase and Fis domain